jgi:hypothetical protein
MTRLLYKSNDTGLLAAKQIITLKDGRKTTVLIDSNALEFNVVDIADATILAGGTAKSLREVKYAARKTLLELGADIGIEVKSAVKKFNNLMKSEGSGDTASNESSN